MSRLHFCLLGQAVFNVVNCDGCGFRDDWVVVLQEWLDLTLVVDHFSDGDKTLVFDDRGLTLILTRLHQKWHCDVEYFLHLGEDKCNFMLQQSAAVGEVLRCQRLADRPTRLLRVNLSQREHGAIPIEQAKVLVVEQNFCQPAHVCVALIIFVIERRCRVVRAELQLLQIDAFSLAVIRRFVPLDQVLCQLASFDDHLGDLAVPVSVLLDQPNRVLV